MMWALRIEYGLLTLSAVMSVVLLGGAGVFLIRRKIRTAATCLGGAIVTVLLWYGLMPGFDATHDFHHMAGHFMFNRCLGNPIPYGRTAMVGLVGGGFGLPTWALRSGIRLG